jgi:hypothetical protein
MDSNTSRTSSAFIRARFLPHRLSFNKPYAAGQPRSSLRSGQTCETTIVYGQVRPAGKLPRLALTMWLTGKRSTTEDKLGKVGRWLEKHGAREDLPIRQGSHTAIE